MASFIEDAIKAYNAIDNNNAGILRGIGLARTYRELASDITQGFTKLPKGNEERIKREPKIVSADTIKGDIENSTRPQTNEILNNNETPYQDKEMDKQKDLSNLNNANNFNDREDI